MGLKEADLALRLLVDVLQEIVLLARPEVILVLWVAAAHAASLRELLLEGAALSLARGVGHDAFSLKVVKHLSWHLLKRLLCKHHRVVLEVSERHKLHDIGRHLLSVALRVERDLVGVKLVHGAEIGGADAHDDDGEGQLGASHDLVDSLLQVSDDTVGDDQQDVVLLVLLGAVHLLCHLVDEVEDGGEVRRSVQRHSIDCVLVGLNYAIQTVDLGIKDVAVQGEAVIALVRVGRDGGTETKSRDLLVTVIVLQDTTD